MENQLGKISKESDGFKVVFKREFKHPIDKVWNAITNPEELKFWFTDIEMDFRPGGKITIQFRDKDKTKSYGEIVSIEPPTKFVWSWEGELAVWELEALDDGTTRLTFSYSKIADDFAISVAAGFHDLLDQLHQRLEGSEEILPFGAEENDPSLFPVRIRYTAYVYDHYPEVLKYQPVVVEKTVNAPVDKVWEALTDKEQMKQWYFEVDDFKPEKGFRFKFAGQGLKGQQYIHRCTVTEVIPNKKLQYSWQYEGFPGYSLVTFNLSQTDTGTEVKLTHYGLETFPQDNHDFAKANFMAGWNELIGKSLPGFCGKQVSPDR
ncbi:SRPBCC domain-containing protein [Negadavirga shengliensis]|uniref:SRPBCC domain-containing protein n=1 Tax=Negadavirga shengliensis TaxID=1389218 RepID=A0ABV9SXD4_9BACT